MLLAFLIQISLRLSQPKTAEDLSQVQLRVRLEMALDHVAWAVGPGFLGPGPNSAKGSTASETSVLPAVLPASVPRDQ